MHLRKLELKDAPHMLAWMHDYGVVQNLHADFGSRTLADCESFIQASQESFESINLAIASDSNEYMGTVSLKHIDREVGNAEFAITVRKEAMGHGYSWFGMEAILKTAFDELGLRSVYWCVSRDNKRAIRFYDKHNFHETVDIPDEILKRYAGMVDLKWYSVLRGDPLDDRKTVAGCKIVHLKTIATVDAGELSYFEAIRDIPFGIVRVYYISKVPEGVRRGFHAHKKLKQLLFCPYGRIKMFLDDGRKREEITLSDPSIGIVIDRPIWREMLWLEKDSVLCVAASDYYDSEDYMRNFADYLNYINMGGAK